MDDRSAIWRHLQDHQITPPRELFEDLQEELDLKNEGEKTNFQMLQEYSISPSMSLTSAVTKAVLRSKLTTVKGILPFIAAACILLILIGVVIDRSSSNRHAASVAEDKSADKPSPETVAPSILDSAASQTETADSASLDLTDLPTSTTHSDNGLSLAFIIDGSRFSLVDNSPLTTLISYEYPALKDRFNKKRDSGFHIRLDQFSNIVLSSGMIGMIRDLYDTRSNGTPSRKARKTKERLIKWKADDERQFDGRLFSNPMDPIDLGEFLFPAFLSFSRHVEPDANRLPHVAQPFGHSASADLTISYALTILTKRENLGIGDTYSGGIETLFLQRTRERLRLASLMRIQSMFLSGDGQHVVLLKESGDKKRTRKLTLQQWIYENRKYAGATYDLTADTVTILGYACKKALISLKNGRQITAWYTTSIKKPALKLEPVFLGVPGVVLSYEYTCRRKTLRYTATAISRQTIDPSVFHIPAGP